MTKGKIAAQVNTMLKKKKGKKLTVSKCGHATLACYKAAKKVNPEVDNIYIQKEDTN